MKQPTLSDLLRDTHVAPALWDRLARRAFNMGVRFPSVQTNTLVNGTLVTTAETAILTTPTFSPAIDGAAIWLMFFISGSTGASTTGMNYRVRQGNGLTGAFVTSLGGINLSVLAGATALYSFAWVGFDLPGIVGGMQYTMTAQQVSATGNGSAAQCAMMAFAL